MYEYLPKRSVLLPLLVAFVVASYTSSATTTSYRDLANFAEQQRGFIIGAEIPGDGFGQVVGTNYNVNGDEFSDILVLAPQSKKLFVVFGHEGPTNFAVGSSFAGFTIFAGESVNAEGMTASFAGDVNNDGFADILVGLPFGGETTGTGPAGISYVVYGSQNLLNSAIDLSFLLTTQGIRIFGDGSGAQCGNAVSAAGDVNGDQIADFLIGCKNASPGGRTNAGAAYVIYGVEGNLRFNVYLSDVGTNGYKISGVENLRLGNSVAALGDLNNDGFADIAVSTDAIFPSTSDIAVCVIYGTFSRSTELDFSAAIEFVGVLLYGGEGGFVVTSTGGSVTTQYDATSDLLISSFQSSYNGRTEAGIAYIVFGSTLGYTSELSNLGSQYGVILYGDRAGDHFGASVSTAGDVNQDGYMDVLVGAPQASASPQGLVRVRSGVVYLLYGNSNLAYTSSIDMEYFIQYGYPGLKILGSTSMSHLGTSVGNAGDLNGDGFPDIVLSAPAVAPGYGEVYVLYGGEQYMSLSPTVSPTARPTFDSAPTFFRDLVVQDFSSTSNLSLVFEGPLANNQLGKALAIGDVNDDSRLDLILSAPYSANNAGQIYVLYGQPDDSNPFPNRDVTALLPSDGFVITGRSSSYAGSSVSFLGDVNQDGFGDIIVGCLYGSPGGPAAAFVIYGTAINLRQPLLSLADFPSSLGFMITASTLIRTYGSFASSVSGAGDMNNDGYADILIGDPAAKSAYVFLGADSLSDISVDLFEFGVSPGFFIRYPQSGDYVIQLGYSVQAAGDLNGDGYADIVIGSSGSNYQWGERAWVVFGAEFLNNIEIGEPGALLRGFKMYGSFDSNVVSRAGDFNNDGFDDLIVGVPSANSPPAYSNYNYCYGCGVAYVLFGHSTEEPFPDLDLPTFVSNPSLGFMIIGDRDYLNSGSSVAAAGDVNGDGIDDIVVGASYQYQGLPSRAYVIFGHTSTEYFGDIGVPDFQSSARGFRLLTNNYYDYFGFVLAAGDLNRDGMSDILTSAPSAVVGVKAQAGIVYAVYGQREGPTAEPTSRLPTVEPTLAPTLPPINTDFQDLVLPGNQPIFMGTAYNENFGSAVTSGDVNGDGISDVIIAARYSQNYAGMIYVKYGGANVFNSTQLANMPSSQGFNVTGISSRQCGRAVSFLGDTNGDGVGDFIVGCSNAAYVVYGSRSLRLTIKLINPGTAAIKITGSSGFGPQVGAAGDVNGDGLADFFAAVPNLNTGAQVFVFFGTTVRSNRLAANLAATGSGFVISSPQYSYKLGQFATSLGDVNGDGFSDIVVGGQRYDPLLNGYKTVGVVIFGHNSSSVPFADILIVDESTVFDGYLFITESTSLQVNKAGDFNGDGFDDMLVGFSGKEVLILFGHSTASPFSKMDLDSFASSSSAGFKVFSTYYGISGGAGRAGDVNGDGIDDIVIGSYSSAPFAYVLFGHTSAEPFADIDVQYFRQQTRGFMIRQSSYSGGSLIADSGDLNNDGIDDLLLGFPYASSGNFYSAGNVFVVTGKFETPTASPTAVPSAPTPTPSWMPTALPTFTPVPTAAPSFAPTLASIDTVFSDVVLNSTSEASEESFRIDGGADSVMLGTAVAFGDVNGDGVSDAVVSAPMASYAGREECGIVAVLFGQGSTVPSFNIDLATLTPDVGVIIYGDSYQHLGFVVSVLGDVNGDHIADLLVGSYNSDGYNGAVFVVYGTLNWTDVDLTIPLASLSPPGGFQVFPYDESVGWSQLTASKAGDVNGDGLADFLVSIPPIAGQIIVVFGSVSGGDVHLAMFVTGVQGYRILGDARVRIGTFMASSGDFNGDGYADFVISTQRTIQTVSNFAPVAQVIYGHNNSIPFADLYLSSVPVAPSVGFAVSAVAGVGVYRVGCAGDFNGDGFSDVMVSNPQYLTSTGRVLVLFGRDATHVLNNGIDFFAPTTTESSGFAVVGGAVQDFSGLSVTSAGDVNGDGFDDILVGARIAYVPNSGMVYVLFGHSSALPFPDINLGEFYSQTRGFRILGGGLGGFLGQVVSSAGDLNQDGYSDIVVVPYAGDSLGRVNNGAAYVVLGKGETPTAGPTAVPSTSIPSVLPTFVPTDEPTMVPSVAPTNAPTQDPTAPPTEGPSASPTAMPSIMPTADPTVNPTRNPSAAPTLNPSLLPTGAPTAHPTILPTEEPSFRPTAHPTVSPSAIPTANPSRSPSGSPSVPPTESPSASPSNVPTPAPSEGPTVAPSVLPSFVPSVNPTEVPTVQPTSPPSSGPTVSPSADPTVGPTAGPTIEPSAFPSAGPTFSPTVNPTIDPTVSPSVVPTVSPTVDPTSDPSASPSADPTVSPTVSPTTDPTVAPSADPTVSPTVSPTPDPSASPSADPTVSPTVGPTSDPSEAPSVVPTVSPTARPTSQPTFVPTCAPTLVPTVDPSAVPSASPSVKPTRKPSTAPSVPPSVGPTFVPSVLPGNTQAPSRAPTQSPSLSSADFWRGELQDLLQTVTVGNSADVAHLATYSELVVATSTPPNLYGSCSSWRTLIQGELTTSNALYRPLSLTLGAQRSLSNTDAPSVVTCGDATSANTILQALLANSEQLQSVTCSERNWVVRACSAGAAPALCVDCEDPCAPSLQCTSSAVNSLVMAPCVAAPVCTGATSLASAARVLSVSYKELQPAPTVVTQTHTASKTTVTVQATLSSAGSVSCGAFEVNAQSGEASAPTSISQILLQKFAASTDVTNTASVMLSGLQAASKYQIYCVAVSPLGTQQTLTQAAAQSFAVSTACCIDVSVSAATSAIKTGSVTSNFLTITVASRPAASVSLLVSLHTSSSGAVATVGSFFPATFTMNALQQATGSTGSPSSASVFTASLPSLPAGEYFYDVTLSGESAYQYAVSYVNPSTALAVLSANEPLPAPILASAVFADDGSHVLISFSAKSNKGDTTTEFNCALLFNFACAEKSTCVWTSSSQVSAYVSSTTGCAAVDSPVSLISSAAVRAECSGSSCGDLLSWPTSSTGVSVTIQSPVSGVAPTVVLSAPNSVGECDSLTLDLSSSSGSGGRPWASRTVLVDSLAPSEVTSALQHLLDASDQSSALLTIPASTISKGFAYSFTVKQCNFLNKCGQSTKRVLAQSSTIPMVTLPGSLLRTVKRSASLSISSEAFFVPCGGSATRAGLTYSWSLAVGGVQDLSFTSASRDPSKLLIAANTLAVNTLYDVTLTVTIASTLQSASATVQVFVAPGNIVPVVALGVSRAVRVDQVVTLDARGSYDEDQVGLSASAAGMTFGWSCVQVAPVLADSCSNVLSISSSSNEGTFVGRAGANAAGAVAQVTLTLLDASQSRTAQTVVTVTILPSLSPVVTATSNAADTGILNSNRELQLVGEVTFPVGYNGSATWSVDDTSVFSLSDSARSPLVTLFGSSGVPQAIYLVVAANSLPDRSTLTFSLTARLHAAGGTSGVASVPVRVNAPPMLGLFSVSPRNGTEIVDKFRFAASQWVDSDLPLQYLFGYVSPSGVEVTLRSKREAAFSTLTLTAGLETDAYAVRCVMHVFDALSAASTRIHTVNVFPEEHDAAALTGLIESSLAEGEDSVDGRKQSAALGSYLLNQVNCTAAPNCTALNRQNCFRTAHTCGECLSVRYVGTAGDSNQACVSVTDLATRRRSLYNNEASSSNGPVRCSSVAQCNPFEMCSSSGVCVRELMQCKGSCSYPQGTCKFVDVNSGEAVDVCYVGDSSCTATCDCAEEYAGSETCSLTASQLLERQSLRLQLVQSITKLIASEDADLESVVGWINTLLQVAQVPDELSEDAAHLLLGAADSIIATASRLGVSTDIVTSLLTAVDAVVQASNDRSVRRRRVLSMGSASSDTRRLLRSENELHNSTLTRSASTLSQFRSFLQQSLLPNQNAVELVLPQFRIVSQVLTGGDSAVSMGLPLSALETANGQSSSQISVPADSTGDSALYISLSSLRSEPFNRELGLSGYDQVFSNPLAVDLTGSSCSGDQCRFQMTLQTSAALSTAVKELRAVESYNTTCVAGVVTSSKVTCADGTVIPVQCDGTDSVVVSSCPVVTYSPVCNALVGVNGPAASGCTIVSTTATSITCSCPIIAAANGRRMQAEGSPDDDTADGSVSVSYVGMLTQIKGNFVNTIVSAQSLNGSTLERGWSAMATVGALAVAILFAFYWSHQADAEMEKVVPASEKAKKLAVANPVLAKRDTRRTKAKRAANTVADRDVQIAEQALPSILSSQSLSKRVTVEVKQHHKWFGIVFHFSRDFPRVLRVASLATNVIIMLFIQSLTYSLTSGDDGSCATYTSQDTCVEERSAYATGASKCYWTESSGECAFVEPDGDIMVILFVAIFSAIVCTPFALLVDWIIIYVLSAPTKVSTSSNQSGDNAAAFNRLRLRTASGEFIESASPTTADNRARTVSTDVYEMTNAIMMGSSRRRTRNESMDIHANRGRTVSTNSEMFEIVPGQINTQHSTLNIGDGHGSARDSVFGSFITLRGNDTAVDNGAQLSAQSDLRLLVEDISRYRDTLSEEDRVEFDLLWGLDEHGCFKSDDELQTGLLHRLKKMLTFSSQSSAVSSGSVSQRVLLDLRAVHENLAKEEALAAARKFDNRQKGRRLLFLFQRDLLPGVSGMILESKGQRDNISAPQVSREAKIAAWIFLAVANVGMLFYILLFALSQTTHRQGAWALSFILWLVVEILLVSSATVVFTHILVPSLIMQDVKKIKMKLVESIRAFNHNVKNRTMYEEDAEQGENGGSSGGPFNAANYLFTSTRLAKKWPELREAQIISQFRTPWPKQSYMRESSVSKSYSRKYTALTRSASIIVIFFMTQILQVPPGLQDMVVQMVATASIGYTILLHLNLYQIFPLLAFLPLMLVIVIVHFVMQSSKASAQQEMNKLLATPPAPPSTKAKGQGSPKLQAIAPAGEPLVNENSAAKAEMLDDEEEDIYSCSSEDENSYGDLNMPLQLSSLRPGAPFSLAQPSGHVNRKQSVQMGVHVLRALQAQHSEPAGDRAEAKHCTETSGVASSGTSDSGSSDSDSEIDATAAVRVPARSGVFLQSNNGNNNNALRSMDDASTLSGNVVADTANALEQKQSTIESESGSEYESESEDDSGGNEGEEEEEEEGSDEGESEEDASEGTSEDEDEESEDEN